jgi:histidyl-tRNA synthetase
MRDLLPADVRRREHVLSVVRRVYESHGFEPLETPSCERLDVLLGKYGEEGDRLLFRVLRRGEDLVRAVAGVQGGEDPDRALCDMALRYELTVPLARVLAAHQGKLPRIFKRYQIQPVWRADRPQKGRFREFWQCDVDIAGSTSHTVEVEVVSAVAEVLAELGFRDFKIRTNHRGVLSGAMEAAGVPPSLERTAITALDKADKIGRDGVLAELAGRGISPESAARLAPLLDPPTGGNAEQIERMRAFLAPSARGLAALDDLAGFLDLVRGSAAEPWISVDPGLARGLDYYTGPVFEIAVADLAGSLGGGGRYDNLVGMFLGREVPACGFSLGLERLVVVMEERGMFAGAAPPVDARVALFDESLVPTSLALARELRAAGLRVDLNHDVEKIGKQYKDADACGVACVALVGPEEASRGAVSLKHLKSGERAEVPRGEAAAWIRARLQPGR